MLQINRSCCSKMVYIIAEIKLELQYEPENLDVYRVCFAK